MPEASGATSLHLIRESLGFAAAHFSVLGDGRERLHGHNYRVTLRATGPVDSRGTVVDFAALKAAVREECALLDHRMLVPTRCEEITVDEADADHLALRVGADRFLFPKDDVYLLPVRNTTCECLAAWLLQRVRARLGTLTARLELGVEESPGQGATVAETAG